MRASSHPDLRIYDQIRRNLGFESLAREPGSGFFWTANEEALHVDGRRATGTHGTVVRLQRLDDALRPVAQYGYVTDPLPGPRPQGRRLRWASGVVELIALPGGRLLALERALVEMEPAVGPVRIRLYEIDLNRAERLGDEALTTGLDDRSYTPVPKSLLISLEFAIESNSNFEGMTLGPHLANGDHSLLLIADNGGGTDQSLYALRISGLPARPCHQSCHSTH
jgi:hypothetical protein